MSPTPNVAPMSPKLLARSCGGVTSAMQAEHTVMLAPEMPLMICAANTHERLGACQSSQ